jgi:Bacteriophage abortive infection AbiH
MANVTFIIGNGLDISLKLNTTYKNFYSYVKRNKLHPNNSIYKAIQKENPIHWADFELGLGRFTKKIEEVTETEREAWSLTLNDELDEIKIDLKQYIQEQNSIADDHIPKINFNYDSFLQGLAAGQISKIRRFMPPNKQTAMRFITLNYTDVLEKLFPNAGRAVLGQKYVIVDKIHHVHGSIDRQISLGVNDDTQISSYIIDDEKKFLIKPELIRQMNDGRLETLANYINVSNIIVLFGVSLGATDKYIWSQVAHWLNSHPDNMLVIHHYESGLDVSDLTERQALLLDDRVKNKFLDQSDMDEDVKNALKLKIYVVPNTKSLFSISRDQ